MRVKTRSGFYTAIPNDSVVKQEKYITKHETYFVLYLSNGKQLATAESVPGMSLSVIDKRRERADVAPVAAPAYASLKLPSASDCPSAGGAMTAVKPIDEHAAERVKGETFFTHKTSPGLVILNPQGNIIHETKMSDMYKRRD